MKRRLPYSNDDSFEGLAALATTLRSDPRLESLAHYCELRERGLRGAAFAELSRFLDDVASRGVSERRLLTTFILESYWREARAHQFLTTPLLKRLVLPVLEEWTTAEPQNPIPACAWALVQPTDGRLRYALSLDPNNIDVRTVLFGFLTGDVDYATHHLSEGLFIGQESDAWNALRAAESLLTGLDHTAAVVAMHQEVKHLTQLLSDWNEYKQHPNGSFPDWCRERGREYRWPSIAYYNAGGG